MFDSLRRVPAAPDSSTGSAAVLAPTGAISVVIPVLDDARLLERSLAALSQQTRPPDEIIVVDNGCIDDSADVARRYGARVVEESRRGVTAASARGFDAARGEIIARCDADSVVPSTWLEQIERTFGSAPDAAAVTGPATFYDLGGARGALARALYIRGYFISMRLMLGNNVLFGSNCAVRASAWCAVSAAVVRDDPEIHDDMDLSYRLSPTSNVIFDPTLVVGISARPFDSFAVFGRRLMRAVRTFSLHLPKQLPHRRWGARVFRTEQIAKTHAGRAMGKLTLRDRVHAVALDDETGIRRAGDR